MKLGEDEIKEHEYYFKTGFFGRVTNDVSHMTVLTNRRLIVTWGNAEHSYPLSKITAVKIIFTRSIKAIVGGVILALIGLGFLESNFLFSLVMIAIGVLIIYYFGWMGKTRLQISQMGGNEYYTVKKRAEKELIELVDKINSKLS